MTSIFSLSLFLLLSLLTKCYVNFDVSILLSITSFNDLPKQYEDRIKISAKIIELLKSILYTRRIILANWKKRF